MTRPNDSCELKPGLGAATRGSVHLLEGSMRFPVLRAGQLAGVALILMLHPRAAAAQSTIAGLVTDSSGAVLPGVSVEAASPVLIEKVRTVVTNSEGRYTIIDLRPGAHVLTFTLPGFNAVRREGLQLGANVDLPVNAELRVGAVEETVTVSGASPVVDVQQAAEREVLSRDVLDSLPTARTFLDAGAIAVAVTTWVAPPWGRGPTSPSGERAAAMIRWKSTASTCGSPTASASPATTTSQWCRM